MSVRGLSALPAPSKPAWKPALQLLWSEADRLAKRLTFITLLVVLASSTVAGLIPLLLKVLVDGLEPMQSYEVYRASLYIVAAYALAHWLTKSLGELRSMVHGCAYQRVQRRLSNAMFQHVMSLPLSFHLARRTGALTQTLTNGLIGYRVMLHHLVLTVLPIIAEVATMGAILIYLDQTIFLAIVGVAVLCYALAFLFAIKRIEGPTRAVSDAHIDANAVLTDSILNYETVKYFTAEAEVTRRFGGSLIKIEGQWAVLFRRKIENGLIVATIFSLSLGASMYVAAQGVRQGSMSIGEFVLVSAYMLQISRPIEMLGFAFRDIAESVGFIGKMIELLDEQQEIGPIGHRASLPAGPPDLVFDQVSYFYHPDHHVLKDVSFVLPSGKTMAIVGASGSGKSSIIRLLLRLIEPVEGQVFFNSVPLNNLSVLALREAIAVVPQDIILFNDSIAYNIRFGRQNISESEILRAAKLAHIHDFIVGLPDGYETAVGERGVKLSGGEKQRLAIARALIKDPKVLAFNEGTSSLDSETELAILSNLVTVAKPTTVLIIAHRLSTIAHADEILVLNRGMVAERGTHNGLLQRHGKYAAMWAAQNSAKRVLPDRVSVA